MPTGTLPSDEEAADLMPGPGSVTWRRAGDARTLMAAGYALVLQVAHPTVGAGVAEHSSFREDPWGRLLRTLDLTNALIYAEPQVAAATARRVRARHRSMTGVRPDGSRYHALEPAAYAWVWASLFAAIVAAHSRFAEPLGSEEQAVFWLEWRDLGRLLGVRERDLPAALGDYRAYFAAMVEDVLEDNTSVRELLAALGRPAAPPLPLYARPAWPLAAIPSGRVLRLATVGMLPGVLRRRLELEWSPAQELELLALGAAARRVAPLVPAALRMFGPSYLRLRGGPNNAAGNRAVA